MGDDDTTAVQRVLLVDDSDDLREILTRILDDTSDFSVVGEASDAGAAVEAAGRERPDVVLLDVRLKGSSGLEVIGAIGEAAPGTRIVVLSASPDRRDEALRLGASGFLDKSFTRGQSFPDRLRSVLRGETADVDDASQAPRQA